MRKGQPRTGLDAAVAALSRHLRALDKRVGDADGELLPDDLESVVAAARALREIQEARASLVLRSLTGRGRLEAMTVAELEQLLDRIENGEDDGAEVFDGAN